MPIHSKSSDNKPVYPVRRAAQRECDSWGPVGVDDESDDTVAEFTDSDFDDGPKAPPRKMSTDTFIGFQLNPNDLK